MRPPTGNDKTQGEHGTYHAIDYSPYPDPDFYAPEDGTITAIFDDVTCGKSAYLVGATGRHGFCHAEKYYVKAGDKVSKGQKIGKMGYTGLTDPDNVPAGTHLHWVLAVNGVYVYPPTKVTEPFGGDMAEKINENTSKILQHGVLARNGVAGRAYSLDGSTGTPWVGGELTNEFLNEIFNSTEAKQWRDSDDPDSVKGINKRLATPAPVPPDSGDSELDKENNALLKQINDTVNKIWAKISSVFK